MVCQSPSISCRADEDKRVIELPFGTTVEGVKQGCFLVLTARAPIYERYTLVPPETRRTPHRVVLMVARWDGLLGLPGGTVESGELLVDALRREAAEEVNFTLGARVPEPLCTHHIVHDRFVVHAFHLDIGDVGVDDLKAISRAAIEADHYLAEGTPFWAHFADYGGKGRRVLMGSTGLIGGVREELEALLAKVG